MSEPDSDSEIPFLLRLAPASRRSLVIVHDIVMTGIAIAAAYWLRFGGDFVAFLAGSRSLAAIGLLIAAAVLVYKMFGLYRGNWRFASIPDLIAIVKAASVLALLLAVLDYFARDALVVPRGVLLAYWMMQIGLLGGPRLLYRAYRDRRRRQRHARESGDDVLSVLLVGTGEEAELFIRSLEHQASPKMRVVGLLTSKPVHLGEWIRGIQVVGLTTALPDAVADLRARGVRPQRLVLTNESFARARDAAAIVAAARQISLPVNRVSNLELQSGHSTATLAPVEMEDLLIRQVAEVDVRAISDLIAGKSVAVTGGGGSIGSEICRQAAALGAGRLIVLENSELALYQISKQLGHSHPELPLTGRILDIRDREKTLKVFARERPDLIFHAAALKHIDLVETNRAAAVLTNTIGTENVADAAIGCGAAAMVMISTDKAIRPASFLGASKRAAELFCQAADAETANKGRGNKGRAKTATKFLSVRFGNVLGSAGSVVWLFKEQIERGGPVTVTHPDMERYFMTIPEATSLVLMAARHALGAADERTSVYVLDMGKPVRIVDLAHKMIALAGLDPERDIKIEFVGMRPGERLAEELFDADETIEKIDVPGVMAAHPTHPGLRQLRKVFRELEKAASAEDDAAMLRLMQDLVPEYEPLRNGVNGKGPARSKEQLAARP